MTASSLRTKECEEAVPRRKHVPPACTCAHPAHKCMQTARTSTRNRNRNRNRRPADRSAGFASAAIGAHLHLRLPTGRPGRPLGADFSNPEYPNSHQRAALPQSRLGRSAKAPSRTRRWQGEALNQPCTRSRCPDGGGHQSVHRHRHLRSAVD